MFFSTYTLSIFKTTGDFGNFFIWFPTFSKLQLMISLIKLPPPALTPFVGAHVCRCYLHRGFLRQDITNNRTPRFCVSILLAFVLSLLNIFLYLLFFPHYFFRENKRKFWTMNWLRFDPYLQNARIHERAG